MGDDDGFSGVFVDDLRAQLGGLLEFGADTGASDDHVGNIPANRCVRNWSEADIL